MTDTSKTAKSSARTHETAEGFTAEEKAAMKERARETKAASRSRAGKADGERDLLAKIAEMSEPDRALAERIHAIVTAAAPTLAPKTWYGMPAYANRDGKVICFFQAASKFKVQVRDVRLPARCEPRRRHDVADRLRGDGADPRRRGEDRQAGEEGGRLKAVPLPVAAGGGIVGREGLPRDEPDAFGQPGWPVPNWRSPASPRPGRM